MGRPETVVDYDAWKRGYMPPSEHVLIDQLAYRGATVNTSSDLGDCAFWIVTRGFRPHGEKMFKIHEILHDLVIEEFKAKKAEAEKLKAPRPDDLLTSAPQQVTGEMNTPSGPQVTRLLSNKPDKK